MRTKYFFQQFLFFFSLASIRRCHCCSFTFNRHSAYRIVYALIAALPHQYITLYGRMTVWYKWHVFCEFIFRPMRWEQKKTRAMAHLRTYFCKAKQNENKCKSACHQTIKWHVSPYMVRENTQVKKPKSICVDVMQNNKSKYDPHVKSKI